MRLGRLGILTLLHWVVDCYAAFVPALWLVLREAFDLSGFETGLLISLVLIPGNIMQPLWGALFDRFDARWIVVIGPAMAVVCLSLAGLAGSFAMTMGMLFLGMLGVGIFHPEAATMANRFSQEGKSRVMAIFLSGGFIGYAVGPWLISQAVSDPHPAWLTAWINRPSHGFADSWLAMFPGLFVVILGTVMMARLGSGSSLKKSARIPLRTAMIGRHRQVGILVTINVVRVFGLIMILFAVPEYLREHGRGQLDVGNWMFLFSAGQFLGVIAGGMTAPAHRERMVLIGSLAAAVLPAMALPFLLGRAAMVVLALTGLCLGWAHPVIVTLGQRIVPDGQRWITGMMIGMSWGIASLAAPPIVGWITQVKGSATVLIFAAGMFAVALGMGIGCLRQSDLDVLKGESRRGTEP